MAVATDAQRQSHHVDGMAPDPDRGYVDQRVKPEIVGPSAVYLALRDARSLTGQLVLRREFGQTWGT